MNARVFFSVIVVAVAVGAGWIALAEEPQDVGQASLDAQLDKLLLERRDTQRRLLDYVTKSYKSGTTTFEMVFQAQSQLLAAELDLAEEKSQRIGILEKQVETLQELENHIKALYEHGARSGEYETYLASRSQRLQAEIELVREKSLSD